MEINRDTRSAIRRTLDRLELCNHAVQELHYELEYPEDPEHKADILIAVEELAYEIMDLLQTARTYAWGPDPEED